MCILYWFIISSCSFTQLKGSPGVHPKVDLHLGQLSRVLGILVLIAMFIKLITSLGMCAWIATRCIGYDLLSQVQMPLSSSGYFPLCWHPLCWQSGMMQMAALSSRVVDRSASIMSMTILWIVSLLRIFSRESCLPVHRFMGIVPHFGHS